MRVGVWGRTYSHRLSRVLASGTSGKPRRKPLHCMGCIGAVVLYGTDGAAGTSLELYGQPVLTLWIALETCLRYAL